jgi:glycogen debranching enzyme
MKASLPLPSLLPGERIVYSRDIPEVAPKKKFSSLIEVERLSLAKNATQVGDFGPVLASESMGGHRHEPELRRYEAVFGRDSLRVALDLIEDYPKLARTTLIRLAETQGIEVNNARAEEPGRIIHELRDPQFDPIARELSLERGWGWPYYGSVDSTPEFIRTLAAYCRSGGVDRDFLKFDYLGRDGRRHHMSHALVAAVEWLLARLDCNPEGLLESKRAVASGIENQVWKDSWDSYFHADGTIANHDLGVASIEVQRLAHDALLDAALIYEKHLDRRNQALELRARAGRLRRVIMQGFWTEDKGGFFVLGTDRDHKGHLRQLKVRSSNMGHVLHSGILSGLDEEITHKREAIIKQLFSDKMLGLSGIMTIASDEIRFRPGAYHNGCVWAWDNYFIAQGLRANGYPGLADFLEKRLLGGIDFSNGFVEYLRGGNDPIYRINTRIVDVWDETNQRVNRLEQPPQDMQAWTAAAVLSIKLSRARHYQYHFMDDDKRQKFADNLLASVN